MRALVTGATGFLGGHLVRRLARDGHEVHAVVRAGSAPARIERLGPAVAIHVHDGSTRGMLDLVETARPEVAFHLACLAISEHTTAQIEELVRSNVLLPSQLLEALSVHGGGRMVNVGSAWQHFESAAYSPTCLYAALKQAVEDVIRFYVETRNLRAVTLKLFHVYGPGDPRPRLVPQLVHGVRSGARLDMTGGEQCVDLVHVDDVSDAFLQAADLLLRDAGIGHRAFAVSSGRGLRVREVVDAFNAVAPRPVRVRFGAKPYRDREILGPLAMGEPLPGWKPRISLDEGLRSVLADPEAMEE